MFVQCLQRVHSVINSCSHALSRQQGVALDWCERAKFSYLSMMTGSDGVSFLLPQLFLSQHRLWRGERKHKNVLVSDM